MLTRDEFISKYRAEIEGWILDAALEGRRGSELSLWLRKLRNNVQLRLGVMYDDLTVLPQGKPDLKPFRGA